MSRQPTQQEKIKANLSDLADLMIELISSCHAAGKTEITPELVKWVKEAYVNKYNLDDMMNNFIKYTRLHWEEIYSKNENYFIEDAIKIFGDIPSDQVNITKVLFQSKDDLGKSIISQVDKNAIWNFVTAMVKISIVHIHKCRKPIRENGEIKYTVQKYSKGDYEVKNLHYFANKFGVDLLGRYTPE